MVSAKLVAWQGWACHHLRGIWACHVKTGGIFNNDKNWLHGRRMDTIDPGTWGFYPLKPKLVKNQLSHSSTRSRLLTKSGWSASPEHSARHLFSMESFVNSFRPWISVIDMEKLPTRLIPSGMTPKPWLTSWSTARFQLLNGWPTSGQRSAGVILPESVQE